MPNYSTNLKTWGSTGSEYPNNYNYAEGEQPVDVWDNFFNSNVINDIEHLISVTNDTITLNGGDGLKNGSSAGLGGSFSLDIEPTDFAGHGLEDDGSDNLRLDGAAVSSGLNGGDGTDLSLDESYAATWTSQHQFSAGLDTRGDIVDDNTTIWDSSGGHVEQSALENADVTVAGNTVSLGGSINVQAGDLTAGGYLDNRSGDRIGVPTYSSEGSLPSGNEGDIAYVEDTDNLYVFNA